MTKPNLPYPTKAAIMIATVAFLAPQFASAQVRRRDVPPPGYVDTAPGAEVRALTERAQQEPGVTSELAPDAKQTATGGPSGGVPGFSGH